MGWRVSLYSVPKHTTDKWKNITNEKYHKERYSLFEDLSKECIFYDTLTDIICEDKKKKLHSDFFTHDIEEDDMVYITISKEQLLNIIEEVRQRIIKWFDGRKVNDDEVGDYWKNPLYVKHAAPCTADFAMKENQKEWNIKANRWKACFKEKNCYLNIDLHDKWKVSGGWSYEYLIFDLIHIYKIFDWENDVLLAIGG